jgi:RNA polymerase sigma factor (sigma-70 family)
MAIWPDDRLIRECIDGNQEAWDGLINRYKNLIYSIPIKQGMSQDDAAEIFQQVCLRLVAELPNLRDPGCLPAWLIAVSWHECSHFFRHAQRYESIEADDQSSQVPSPADAPESLLLGSEQEQILREAILQIAPRCRELLRMLFFEAPARTYEDVAQSLGLTRNSVGFIRMRCLRRLRRLLEKKGFR